MLLCAQLVNWPTGEPFLARFMDFERMDDGVGVSIAAPHVVVPPVADLSVFFLTWTFVFRRDG